MKITNSFHGDPALKAALMAQLQAHYDHDEIAKGTYWENGKGCAIGCALHSGNHAEYVTRWDIPEALARLADAIFEGLPNALAKDWVLRFHNAIPVGSDLSRVQWSFLHRILMDEGINPGINHPPVKDAVGQVAGLMNRLASGESVSARAADARDAAADARDAARAADARAGAWAARAAAEAARAAAEAAGAAAGAAAAALDAAAAALDAGAAAEAAWAARAAAYTKMGDALIELIGTAGKEATP